MKKLITTQLMVIAMLGLALPMFAQKTTNAQNPASLQKPWYQYVFSNDSLAGFNEANANQDALNRKCFGVEYYMYMYMQKRTFINQKYSLRPVVVNPNNNSNTNYINAKPIISPTNQVNAAPCVNEDFESSPSTTLSTVAAAIGNTLTGWQVGSVNTMVTPYNNCTSILPTTPGNTNSWVRSTPWTPPAQTMLGTINTSPFGGTKVLQMNDDLAGGKGIRIQQTFPVTASNCLFQVAYRAALLSGHACCENPYIKIRVIDCNNNVLTCPLVDVQPPGPSCSTVTATGWLTNSSTWVTYTPNWMIKSLDLTPYLGSCVTILIEVGDCPYGGHWGTAYVDCQCLPMNLTVNNILFSAAQPVSFVAACGVLTATMIAPPGLGPYTWNGPASSTITNNPNQTILTTVPGNYTLTMNPPGSCSPITKTVNLQFGNFPTPGFSVTNNCTTYTITNTGSPAPAVQNYTIVGPGGPPQYSTTATSNVVNLNPNTTYTIFQTIVNAQNCPATFSMVITTPNGPSAAFNTPTNICITTTPSYSAVVSAGSHTYSFASNTTVPGPIFTNPTGPITFPAVGTYTITHTINSGGCIASTSSVISVGPVPSATASAIAPACVGANATLQAVGGPGMMTWTGPNAYSASGPTVFVGNFQPVNAGIYTLTVNNMGCTITKTVALTSPTTPSVTVSNNGPICAGSNLVLTATWPASVTPSWYYWYTYIPSPYYYSYGGYNIATFTIPATTTANAVPHTFYIQFNAACPAVIYTTNVSIITVTTPIASNTGPYCPGATIQLNANVFSQPTYTWAGPNSFASTVQNPVIANATPAMSGNYTITTGSGACTKTAVTTVSVHPNPTATPASNSPVCLNTPINLTSAAASSYTWTGPNAFTSNAQNPTIASAQLVNAGTYTLKITAANGCTAMATVTVGVLTPTVGASNTGPYCAGQTLSVSATAATSYTWTGPNAFASNLQGPTVANAQPVASGNYTVIASIGSCTASAVTPVVVNALPVPAPVNTGPYCPGQTIFLSTNAFNTYTWTGPNSFASNAQGPSIPNAAVSMSGPYTVAVTNANGCTNTAVTNVTVNPNPTATPGSNSPVCINTSINLTSAAAASYTWTGPNAFASNAQNPTIPNAQLASGGTYTLMITAATGCTAMATVSVSVLNPTVGASNGGNICANNTLTLSATAATSYTWSGPNAFSSNVQNPNIAAAQPVSTGNYTLIASIGSCTASATTAVTVFALPVPTPTNMGPYCPGQQVNFTTNAFTTYTWTGPNAFSSNVQSPNIPFALVTQSGPYTLTVKDANGCVSSSVTNLVVNPIPNVTAGGNSPVCINTSINLTSSAASTYTWSGPNAFTSNAQNPVIANAQLVNTGNYTVMITAATGCTNVATTSITVLNPTVGASNTGPYCAGATVLLNATAANSYNWTGPNGFFSASQSPTIPNAQPIATGVYSVIATIGTCTAGATTSVTVNALPVPVPANTGPYCAGQTIQLTVNAFATYTWSGPAFASNAQNPTIPNSTTAMTAPYVVTVKDANGCINTGTTNVTVNPLPVVGVNSPTACLNTNLNLSATGGTAYSWVGPAAFASLLQNPVIPNAQLINGGNYTVTVTSNFGCINTGILTASVVSLPVVGIAGTNTMCSQNFNGSPAQVTISGSGANGYNFTLPAGWNGFPSTAAQSFTLTPPITAVQAVAQLSVVGTGPGGCTNTAVYDVTVVPNPVIAAIGGSMCAGTSVNLSVAGANTFTWSPAATLNTANGPNVIASPANTTIYSIIGSSNGCQSQTQNATASVVANPTVTIAPGQPTICIGQTINLTAAGATTYSWVPGSNLNTTSGPVVQANPPSTQTYSVFGSQNTCTHVAAITVTVRPLPNVFVAVSSPTMCMNNFNGSPNSVSVIGGGANSYVWGGFTGLTASSNNGPSIIVTSILQSPVGTGTVQGYDGYCYNTVGFTVAAIPNPTIAVTSESMCLGTSVDLVASGANNYTWSPFQFFTSTNSSTITAFPPTNQVYNVFGEVAGCNSDTKSGTVTVVAPPSMVISPVNPTICAGQSIGLTAFGANGYTWTPAATVSNPNSAFVIVNPTVTTNYTVIGEASTCTSSAVRQVSVIQLPDLSASGKSAICKGDKALINANGAETYTWLPHFGMNPNEYHSNFVTLTPTISTTYTIYGQNGPCFNAIEYPVLVLDYPVLQLATDHQKICFGKSTSIFGMGAMQYIFTPTVNLQVLNNNMVQVTPTVSTNYTVMGLNIAAGSATCMMTKEILIDVVPTITASATRTAEICRGQSVKLSSGGSNTFVWAPSTGLSSSVISQPYASPEETTLYTVNVSDGGFCTETATCLVVVKETPTVYAGEDFTMNIDDAGFLNARGSGTLKWILGDGIVCHDCPNSQILPQTSGCYQIQATSTNGCTAIDEVCIEITKDYSVYIPNVFTPNFDGLNDTFLVYGVGISEIGVTIFDRWGEQIYHSDEQTKGWDGTVRDAEGKQDVYTYLVTYKSIDGKKHTKTGHVTLLK